MSETVEVVRVVPAAPATAYRVWTEPEHVRRWWRPHGLSASLVEIDLRVGGRYRIGMEPGPLFVGGAFRELAPPHRLAYTWEWENGEFAGAGESLVTVEFRPVAAGTEVVVTHAPLPGPAGPAHASGWADCLAALAAGSANDLH